MKAQIETEGGFQMKNVITRPPPFDLASGIDKRMILHGLVRMNHVRIVVLATMITGTTNWVRGKSVNSSSDYYINGISLSGIGTGGDGNVGAAASQWHGSKQPASGEGEELL
jgi:hypothetical protein